MLKPGLVGARSGTITEDEIWTGCGCPPPGGISAVGPLLPPTITLPLEPRNDTGGEPCGDGSGVADESCNLQVSNSLTVLSQSMR